MLIAYLIICAICTFVLLVIAVRERNVRPSKTSDLQEALLPSNDIDAAAAETEPVMEAVQPEQQECHVEGRTDRVPVSSRY